MSINDKRKISHDPFSKNSFLDYVDEEDKHSNPMPRKVSVDPLNYTLPSVPHAVKSSYPKVVKKKDSISTTFKKPKKTKTKKSTKKTGPIVTCESTKIKDELKGFRKSTSRNVSNNLKSTYTGIIMFNKTVEVRYFKSSLDHPLTSSIIDLWERENPKEAVFYNDKRNCYVRLDESPIYNVEKYNAVYGYWGRTLNSVYSKRNQNRKIFDFEKDQWSLFRVEHWSI